MAAVIVDEVVYSVARPDEKAFAVSEDGTRRHVIRPQLPAHLLHFPVNLQGLQANLPAEPVRYAVASVPSNPFEKEMGKVLLPKGKGADEDDMGNSARP